ncbi:MAG TPA: YdcF family protein [Acidimicrobiales bacterium]|nr:YdcF family protein [Acidimicrobiales bacterium]
MISTLRQAAERPSDSGRARRSLRRSFRRLAWRGLGLLVLAGVVYVAVTFVQVWMASRRDGARTADAIVVLGAAQYDCQPSPVLATRLDHTLALYRDGVAGRIVVTGGRRAGDRCTEARSSAEYLMREGVPEADLLRENDGTNSWESLAASARILRAEGLTRVVLVTDGYHALRVQAIAGELGLDASVSPSDAGGSVRDYIEETGAVAIGRIVGFRRLVDIDGPVE